ncbi:MAG: T9SS type A sorting domain-containing protein [Bacteroidia bacterium]|nr:T9SS type A sorting domain-containing protein [Bacteroidia bacterium]
MKKNQHILLCIFILCSNMFSFDLFAQQSLYTEDFSGQLNQGLTGPVPGSFSFSSLNGKWNVSVGATSGMTDANDHARVEDSVIGFTQTGLPSGFAFQYRDVDEPTTWRTQVIDISNWDSAQFSLDLFEVGSLESSDFTEVAFILDGVRTVVYQAFDDYSDPDGTGSSDPTDPGNINPVVQTISQSGLTGSNLEIEVLVDVNSSSELVHIDNVQVNGFGFNPPVCTISIDSAFAECDAKTSGLDTYTATFFYSGAGNGDYTVSSTIGITIVDDDPDVNATGQVRVTGVPEGTSVVVVFNGVNCSNQGDTLLLQACTQDPPGAFTLDTISTDIPYFPMLAWSQSAGADSYRVELSVNGAAFEYRDSVDFSNLEFVDTLLVVGDPITYRVRAFNEAGSTLSNELTTNMPSFIDSLEFAFDCYRTNDDLLVWTVTNPNAFSLPFLLVQPNSGRRETLIIEGNATYDVYLPNNPQDPNTPGDDNATGIYWIDHTLQVAMPNIIINEADLTQVCDSTRPSNPQAPNGPAYLYTAELIAPFYQIPTNLISVIPEGLISVGPNPFEDQLLIKSEGAQGQARLSMSDLNGRLVLERNIDLEYPSSINLSEVPGGMYLLRIESGRGLYTQKLMKR